MPSANHSADTSRALWGSWYSMNTTSLDSRLRGNDVVGRDDGGVMGVSAGVMGVEGTRMVDGPKYCVGRDGVV